MNWTSVFRPNLFEGRVALVTGGGTGIGRTIVTELAYLGCTVIIASRQEEVCQEAAQEINQALPTTCVGKVLAGPATNIRKVESVAALIEYCIQATPSKALHYVVNNAGGQFISPAEDLSPRGFQAVVETNLVGTFLVCQQAYVQSMSSHNAVEAGFACSIVNITLGNRNGMPYMVHSGAARAGVENMTATLCTEWIESGVRINCVRPGVIWTESGFAAYGEQGAAYAQKLLPSMPAKRFGTPQEVGSAVVWLLSDAASYVTGAVLCVDGGSSYTYLPLVDIPNEMNLPTYGTPLPTQARL
uniref:Peroxisomal trans-2-enoyl-CoA reductase n=1 Tax=Entomoneis paludosa TaxID=265537 RepID=A0A7S2YKB5_9STRA